MKALISTFAASALIAGSLYATAAVAQGTVPPSNQANAHLQPSPGDDPTTRNPTSPVPNHSIAPQMAQSTQDTGAGDATGTTATPKKKTAKKPVHHTQKAKSSKNAAKKKTTPASSSTPSGGTATGRTTTGNTTVGSTTTGNPPQSPAAPQQSYRGQGPSTPPVNNSAQSPGAPATAPGTGNDNTSNTTQ